jgi:hypothetical protein
MGLDDPRLEGDCTLVGESSSTTHAPEKHFKRAMGESKLVSKFEPQLERPSKLFDEGVGQRLVCHVRIARAAAGQNYWVPGGWPSAASMP